jgi:hypothetical protein
MGRLHKKIQDAEPSQVTRYDPEEPTVFNLAQPEIKSSLVESDFSSNVRPVQPTHLPLVFIAKYKLRSFLPK